MAQQFNYMGRFISILLLFVSALAFGQSNMMVLSTPASEESVTYREGFAYFFENNTDNEVGTAWTNTGPLTFSTTPTTIPEGTYCAYDNSTSGDYITIIDFTFSATGFSVAFWYYTSTESTNFRVFGNNNFEVKFATLGNDIDIIEDDNTVEFNNVGTIIGQWNHYVIVYDKTTPSCKVYFNGSETSIDAGSVDGGSTLTGTWYFLHDAAGYIDDARGYDEKITSDDVTAIYTYPGVLLEN